MRDRPTLREPRPFLGEFYDALLAELDGGNPLLDPEQSAALRAYYRNLIHKPRRRPWYRYNWLQRVAPMARALAELAQRRGGIRVLDAGCGFGTESILWRCLGPQVSVIGVDCEPVRLAAARRRTDCYARRFAPMGPGEFVNDDVFDALARGPFDAIWTMEAISHIHPAERFIREARRALRPGGCLAISDSSLLNPAMALKVWRLRRRGWRVSTRTTADGKDVEVGAELLFSPAGIARRMRRAGLAVCAREVHLFFPPVVAHSGLLMEAARLWDRVAGSAPGLREFGGVYTVIGRAPDRA